MGLFLKDQEMYLPKLDSVDVSFGNLFIGSERFFVFENGKDRYSIILKPKNIGLEPKVVFRVKIAGFDAEILLNVLSNLGKIDSKFADIDLALFSDDVREALIKSLFEREFVAFSAKIGLQIRLDGVSFQCENPNNYEKEIGVTVIKNDSGVVTFNVRLGGDLLQTINAKFEKIEPVKRELDDGLIFQWSLEVGKTQLSMQDYQNLEEDDIVFFDEDAGVRTGKYQIKGLIDGPLTGTLNGCNLVLDSGQF
jgi:hypothetical protein